MIATSRNEVFDPFDINNNPLHVLTSQQRPGQPFSPNPTQVPSQQETAGSSQQETAGSSQQEIAGSSQQETAGSSQQEAPVKDIKGKGKAT